MNATALDLLTSTPSKARRFRLAYEGLLRYLDARTRACPAAFEPGRAPAIASVLANACWWMTTPAREVIADIGLAIFAFDDLVDEHDIELEDVEFRCAQLVALACGEPCPELAFDPSADALAEVATRLRATRGCEALWADWVETFGACFGAIVENRRAAELPVAKLELDAYLEVGRDSVGVTPVCVAAALLVGDARVVEGRDAFMAALATRGRSERNAAARVLENADLGPIGHFVLDFTDALIALYDVGDFRGDATATELRPAC